LIGISHISERAFKREIEERGEGDGYALGYEKRHLSNSVGCEKELSNIIKVFVK
jgi:hypothetical protein